MSGSDQNRFASAVEKPAGPHRTDSRRRAAGFVSLLSWRAARHQRAILVDWLQVAGVAAEAEQIAVGAAGVPRPG